MTDTDTADPQTRAARAMRDCYDSGGAVITTPVLLDWLRDERRLPDVNLDGDGLHVCTPFMMHGDADPTIRVGVLAKEEGQATPWATVVDVAPREWERVRGLNATFLEDAVTPDGQVRTPLQRTAYRMADRSGA